MSRLPILLALPFVLVCGTALADKIDGSWCAGERHLSIEGPRIVTPAGSRLDGLYFRHSFSYIAPPGETESGAVVQLRLLDEDTMDFRAGADGMPEIWKRCTPISALRLPVQG